VKRITGAQREELKKPMGLIVEAIAEGAVTVGDVCSAKAITRGANPVLVVYDKRVQRRPAPSEAKVIESYEAKKVRVRNDPGTVSDEADQAVKSALESKVRTKIEVEGEEDLIVLPVLVHGKEGTKLYYGQPNGGMVEVTITKQAKQKASRILSQMEEI
jgi:hypothetical protein